MKKYLTSSVKYRDDFETNPGVYLTLFDFFEAEWNCYSSFVVCINSLLMLLYFFLAHNHNLSSFAHTHSTNRWKKKHNFFVLRFSFFLVFCCFFFVQSYFFFRVLYFIFGVLYSSSFFIVCRSARVILSKYGRLPTHTSLRLYFFSF